MVEERKPVGVHRAEAFSFGPERYGRDGRIGIIVPANNSLIEPELWSVLPENVSLHATRVYAKGDLTPEVVRQNTVHAQRAVEELALTGVDFIVYADMVPTLIMEQGWNEAKAQAVRTTFGIAGSTAWISTQKALQALKARNIAVLTPYPENVHELVSPFFAQSGYSVQSDMTLNIESMRDVPRVQPERILDAVTSMHMNDADTLVILATDLPTFDVITAIEEMCQVNVVTSNQSILWNSLREIGHSYTSSKLGSLFRKY